MNSSQQKFHKRRIWYFCLYILSIYVYICTHITRTFLSFLALCPCLLPYSRISRRKNTAQDDEGVKPKIKLVQAYTGTGRGPGGSTAGCLHKEPLSFPSVLSALIAQSGAVPQPQGRDLHLPDLSANLRGCAPAWSWGTAGGSGTVGPFI